MSDKEWKAMYELAIEQRNQARSESARLHAERDALRAELLNIADIGKRHEIAKCACSWCSDIRAARAALKEAT